MPSRFVNIGEIFICALKICQSVEASPLWRALHVCSGDGTVHTVTWRRSITPLCPDACSFPFTVRVTTRRSILVGNDPLRFLSSPQYLRCCSAFASIALGRASPPRRPFLVKQLVLLYKLCVAKTVMPVKHSLSGDTNSYGRLHWGETRQKIRSSLGWPLDVVFWPDVGLGGVWGEEASSGLTAVKHHDRGTKPKLRSLSAVMTGCMSSIGTDLMYVCGVSDPQAPHWTI